MSHRTVHQRTSSRHRRRNPLRRDAFLARAAERLFGAADLSAIETCIASLALPHEGGWCIVDLVERGRLRRLPVVHAESAKQALARRLEGGWPPPRDELSGLPRVVRTGASEIVARVTPEMLDAEAGSPGALDTLRRLGIGSLMVVPLRGSRDTLGAITHLSPESGHRFTAADEACAERVARWIAARLEEARACAAALEAAQAAEAANRAKMAFLATLSHELRTPLNAIAGYVALLHDGVRGPLTAQQRADLHRIQRNERHLRGLVESVLTYARLDAGRLEFELEDVPLSAILDEVQAIVEPIAELKGVTYVPPDPGLARALVMRTDRRKLCQVLVNLVTNAVKFTPRGGRVCITGRRGSRLAMIRVADSGVGIEPARLAQIFEPFTRVHGRGTAGEDGTGLGLAISRRLARGMGGDLFATSRRGRGSVFTVAVPLASSWSSAA